MKTQTSTYTISIPEPCHEDWNSMQLDAKGRFCGSCSKSVVDFTNKTDLEIRDILMTHKDQKLCGHLKSSQLNRALSLRIDLNNLPANMSNTKRFALAVFMVFGTLLFSCTDVKGQVIQDLKIDTTETMTFTKGKIKLREKTEETLTGDISSEIVREDTLTIVTDSLINPLEPLVMGGMRYIETPIAAIDTTPNFILPDSTLQDINFVTSGFMVVKETQPEDTLVPALNEQDKLFTPLPDFTFDPEPKILLYPNPATEEFSIRYEVLKRADVKVEIYDEKGSLIQTIVDMDQQYEGKYTIPIDLKDFHNGIYFINVMNDRKRYTKKLVVQK